MPKLAHIQKQMAEGEKWVTINGSPVLIGEGGEIKGGAGGKLRGRPFNPKSKSKPRRHLNLLRERLLVGGLKRGERKLIERRIENLSRQIIEDENRKQMSEVIAMVKVKEMVVFKTGTWNGEQFTEDDLDNMAKSFNAAEPPHIIVGHSSDYKGHTRIPSFGRILGGLKRVVKNLIAYGVEFNEKLAEWIREGFYNQRSIELSRDNKRVLAVGVLGAVPPAVKGLPGNDDALNEVALEYSAIGLEAKIIEFADNKDIDFGDLRNAANEDTMENVEECFGVCASEMADYLENDHDPKECKEHCMKAMMDCYEQVSQELHQHAAFSEKLIGMLPAKEEEIEGEMEKEKTTMMAKLKEWLGITSQSTKESDMDATKEKEYQEKISGLETQVKEFAEKERLAKEAIAVAEKATKDAAEKAKSDALTAEVKTFCETAVKEGRMTPAMVEIDNPIMLNLAKVDPSALKSFQEKYAKPIVPTGTVSEIDQHGADDNRPQILQSAEKYAVSHKADKEFAGLTAANAISRAVYLHGIGQIKFEAESTINQKGA